MRLFAKEAWGYAILLLILFAIAAIAVWQTILHIEGIVPATEFPTLAALIWALCLGFMFIAGAFGLWSIQFSAIAESRRRISELVTAMDYMRDGLLAIDRSGRVRGSNPAAHEQCGITPGEHTHLREMYTCLSGEDEAALLNHQEPRELERATTREGQPQTLRFRSQPSAGVNLVLVSNVTSMQMRRRHRQQAATLQLVGQLARGVANDFNSLLCGIAGHASLLPRLKDASPERQASLQAISQAAEHGIALAGHLLDLSRPTSTGRPTGMTARHVRNAVAVLRDALPPGWHIEMTLEEPSPIAFTGMQVEQIVTNLGQLLADQLPARGVLHVLCGPPGSHPLLASEAGYVGSVAITGDLPEGSALLPAPDPESGGVVYSVLQSIIEGAGGALHRLVGAGDLPVFRVDLPPAPLEPDTEGVTELPFELGAYLSNWRIVFGGSKSAYAGLLSAMADYNVNVTAVDTIPSVLSRIEEAGRLDAILLDWSLLGTEEEGILKAIEKLAPSTGLVVLREGSSETVRHHHRRILDVDTGTAPNDVLMALIESRSLAVAQRG